ncbi:MAG TPA: NAD(P)H-binding protein [Trebonia sp.]|jgi:putative NADH-flavin reductase|nr:NAD(P)H-binding protein [Trebonia sp.]
MATIAIFGGTGYAGSAIRDEALKRGYRVISVTRSGKPDGLQDSAAEFRQGSVHDADLVDRVAAEADVVVVSIRFAPTADGTRLIDAFPVLTSACAAHGTRLGVVGGAASLLVSEGGPRLIDTPEFTDAFKPEAGSAASVLDALRADTSGVDWFFVSPAQQFGSHAPGEPLGRYRVGDDVLLTDETGRSHISGADYALAFIDEIDNPRHHGTRFTVAY